MGKKSKKKGANNNKKKSKKSAVSTTPQQQQQQQPPSHRDETSTTNTTTKREFFVGDRVWFVGKRDRLNDTGGVVHWDIFDPNTFRGYIREIRGDDSILGKLGITTLHSLMEGRDEEMVWGELIVIVSCYINV